MPQKWIKVHLKARKRKGFTSYITAYWQDGERRYGSSFRSRKLADEYRNKLEQYINGTGPNPDDAVPKRTQEIPANTVAGESWIDAVDRFVKAGSKRVTTANSCKAALRAFADHAGITAVAQLNPEIVAKTCQKLHDDKKSRATIATYLRNVAWFAKWLRLPSPLTDEIRGEWAPYSKKNKKDDAHWYTEDEFNRIIKACAVVGKQKIAEKGRGAGKPGRGIKPGERTPLWWESFITLLHDCGLRFNEAAHLTIYDADFGQGEIRIRPHNRMPGAIDWQPKGATARTIGMTPRVSDLLAKMVEAIPEGDKTPYLFVPAQRYTEALKSPDKPLINGVLKAFVAIRKRAGVMEGTLHDFRYTAIANWFMDGLNPTDVQTLAGHEDVDTTLSVYARVLRHQSVQRQKAAMGTQELTARKEKNAATIAAKK